MNEPMKEHCKNAEECAEEKCIEDCEKWEDSHVRLTHETKSLSCKLSQKELVGKGQEMVTAMSDIEVIEGERKGVVEEYKGRIAEIMGRIVKIKAVMQSGSEQRDIACVTTKDFNSGKVVTKRTDTEEVIDEKEMQKEQQEMHFVSEPPNGEEVVETDEDPVEETEEPDAEERMGEAADAIANSLDTPEDEFDAIAAAAEAVEEEE